jgi:Ser/Thr protein kinase RdoA (MazF antagonist)
VDQRLRSIGRQFQIEGELAEADRIKSGHIHDTYLARYRCAGRVGEVAGLRVVHQRVNHPVFRDPVALMDNLARVTAHLRAGLTRRGVADLSRRCLTLVPARDGRLFHLDGEGQTWRTFHFIEGARTHDTVARPEQAFRAARAFGEFAALLADLPPPPLAETIPHFHDLPKRFTNLEEAVRVDRCARANLVRAEIDAARRGHSRLEEALRSCGAMELPRRVVHNDCKINNVMFDEESGEALCVIDLDTVMDGTVLCDFGELVRTTTCRAPEDEPDLDRIHFNLELFAAVARGYLEGADGLLTEPERRALPVAGALLAFENGIRFLTDHLAGDHYFRIHREGQNLDRARAQLRLFQLILEQQPQARRLLGEAAAG